jgi:glycosyltransferase involved in cell wall biosynthesis
LDVLLVPPLPADWWVSIERYVEAIEVAGAAAGLRVSRAFPPLTVPRNGLGRYRIRHRSYLEALLSGDYRADVVHIPDQALGHLASAFPGVATVVTCHDLMPLLVEGHYASRFEAWFDGHLLARSLAGLAAASRIICISGATRDAVVRMLDIDAGRIDVVPNMVHEAYHGTVEPAVGLPPGPRVLSVGRSAAYKNLEATLAAVALLPGAQLIRVGEPLTPDQRQLAANTGLAGRITEMGHLEPPELARVYRACGALVQPSTYEGFGVPVVEAMACGLPVVCSDGGALAEVAGGAALVVPLASADFPAALAMAVERVLSEPQTASMLKTRGFERVQAFRPATVLPQLVSSYRRAIEEYAR